MLRKIVFTKPKKTRKARRLVDWQEAADIKSRIVYLVAALDMDWIDVARIFCFRSEKSTANAYARIWGLGKIWQQALETDAAYCLEVLSEKYDNLTVKKKDEVLIHELCHIPHTFSGSLLPHTKRGKNSFHDRVDQLVRNYKRKGLDSN